MSGQHTWQRMHLSSHVTCFVMRIILKAAASINGYISGPFESRQTFSGSLDLAAVDKLRASVDAIVISGKTIRRDNPSLRVRNRAEVDQGAKNPTRVIFSKTGSFEPDSRVFRRDDYDREPAVILCMPSEQCSRFKERFQELSKNIEPHILTKPLYGHEESGIALRELCEFLQSAGMKRVLFESGGELATGLLQAGLVDEFRLSISAVAVPKEQGAKPLLPVNEATEFGLRLLEVEKQGENAVLTFCRAAADCVPQQ